MCVCVCVCVTIDASVYVCAIYTSVLWSCDMQRIEVVHLQSNYPYKLKQCVCTTNKMAMCHTRV